MDTDHFWQIIDRWNVNEIEPLFTNENIRSTIHPLVLEHVFRMACEEQERLPVAQMMIPYMPDVDYVFDIACRYNQIELVEMLLDRVKKSSTFFWLVCIKNKTDILRVFLRKGLVSRYANICIQFIDDMDQQLLREIAINCRIIRKMAADRTFIKTVIQEHVNIINTVVGFIKQTNQEVYTVVHRIFRERILECIPRIYYGEPDGILLKRAVEIVQRLVTKKEVGIKRNRQI